MNPKAPHSVYRIYDKRGLLLYIGCAQDVQGRINLHMEFSNRNINSWFIRQHMAEHTETEFPNKAVASVAEKRAIKDEAPLLNVHHNLGREIPRAVITSISVQEQELFLDTVADYFRAMAA